MNELIPPLDVDGVPSFPIEMPRILFVPDYSGTIFFCYFY